MSATSSDLSTQSGNAVMARLLRWDRLQAVKRTAMFLFGLPLSLVGPAVLATMLWFAAVMFDLVAFRGTWTSFWWAAVIVVVPSAFMAEVRTRGDYLAQAVRGSHAFVPPGAMLMPDVYRQLALLASVASNPRGTAAGLVEIFLFGPRLVVGAVRQARRARRLRGVDRARASAVVQQLLKVHGGIEVSRLLRPGENPTDIVPPLTWLALEGWIGVNQDGDRAWLTPDGRAALTP